jgi:hypothetical protein
LGSDVESQFNKGMAETLKRTDIIVEDFTIGKSENLRCQIIAGTKCLVDVNMTWMGD